MNLVSRTIAGIVMIALGTFIGVSTYLEAAYISEIIWGVIWGAGVALIGTYLLFHKKEDDIEQINDK